MYVLCAFLELKLNIVHCTRIGFFPNLFISSIMVVQDDSKQHSYSLPNNSYFKSLSQDTGYQQVRFVMIWIEFIFSRFKPILLGASGEGFRKQTKEEKSLFILRGLVSCDANETSFELPLIKIAHCGVCIKRRWPYIYCKNHCFVRKKTNQNVTGFPEVFQFLNIVLRSHLIKRTL